MTSPMLHKTNYDLANCKTGIVHLGYGAFHRAHQSVYIDDYMEKTGAISFRPTGSLLDQISGETNGNDEHLRNQENQ